MGNISNNTASELLKHLDYIVNHSVAKFDIIDLEEIQALVKKAKNEKYYSNTFRGESYKRILETIESLLKKDNSITIETGIWLNSIGIIDAKWNFTHNHPNVPKDLNDSIEELIEKYY